VRSTRPLAIEVREMGGYSSGVMGGMMRMISGGVERGREEIRAILVVSESETLVVDDEFGMSSWKGDELIGKLDAKEDLMAIFEEMNVSRASLSLDLLRVALSPDGKAATLAIRSSSPSDHRLYLVYYAHSENALVLENIQFLNRYPSSLIPSLRCMGLSVVNSRSGHTAYATYQSPSQPVCISAVYFHKDKTIPPILHDMELPIAIIPSLVQGGVGSSPSMDGTLLLSTTGCIVQARIHVQEKEVVEVVDDAANQNHNLISHLLSSFQSNRNSDATDAAIMSSLPPSLHNLSSSALDPLIDKCAKIIHTDQNVNGITEGEILGTMLETHQSFVQFLIHAGLHRRLTTEKYLLMETGEKIKGALAIVEYCQNCDGDVTQLHDFLSGIHGKTYELLHHLGVLQNEMVDLAAKKTHCFVLAAAFDAALAYRRESREMIYDLTADLDSNAKPWTTARPARDLLTAFLLSLNPKSD